MSINEEDAATWIQPMHSSLARNTIASKIRILRMFLLHLQNKGIPAYIPRYVKVPDTYIPHLFSDAEIQAIFTAADIIPHRKKSKHAIVLPMVLRMLYSCGFRLGELLAIRVGDINFKRGLVLPRDTKNQKQRLVPLGNALTEMVCQYCLAMGVMECAENYIFPGKDKTKHISQRVIQEWFGTLLEDTDIFVRTKRCARGPSPENGQRPGAPAARLQPRGGPGPAHRNTPRPRLWIQVLSRKGSVPP